MNVTTLNLAGYRNWSEREARIVSFLNTSHSDIIFLQEVKLDTTHAPVPQSVYLNSLLDTPYLHSQSAVSRFYQSSDGGQQREGLAVLSRYQIIDSEVIVLTKRSDDKHTRIIQKVRLLVDGQIVSFVNVHFSNNQYSDEQLEETLQYIRASGEASVILGDFNIFDITAVKHLYENSYVTSTEIADYISFPSEAATFDYVLVPKQYQLSSLETHEGLSDHNALTCKLAT